MFNTVMGAKVFSVSLSKTPSVITTSSLGNLGFMLMVYTVLQVITGVGAACYLDLSVEGCLQSKLFLIKEVGWGWAASFVHFVVPTVLFLLVYVHILSGVLSQTMQDGGLWGSGVFTFLLFMMVSFTGYSLVFGSMSFWALVVIQNIMAYVMGRSVASSVLFDGDVSFYGYVLNKVFVYHFLFGILVLVGMAVHVSILHDSGSSATVSCGISEPCLLSSFILLKDIVLSLFLGVVLVFLMEEFLEVVVSTDNYLEVDALEVPSEINPEWFLSFFFMVLKSVSGKLMGIVLMFSVLGFLLMSPVCKGLFGEFLSCKGLFVGAYAMSGLMILVTYHAYGGGLQASSVFLFLFMMLVMDMLGFCNSLVSGSASGFVFLS